MISELRMLMNNIEMHAMDGRFDAARAALQRAGGVIHRMDAADQARIVPRAVSDPVVIVVNANENMKNAESATEKDRNVKTWDHLSDEEIAALVCDDRR